MICHNTEEMEIYEGVSEDDTSSTHLSFDIASYPSDLTLSVLYEMWRDGDISIPEFQRKFVWTIKQSSLLIESFLLGLPVPQVFFYIDETHKNLVIDGQQRILSIVFFFEGYFGGESNGKRRVFRLTGLPEGSPFSKLRFKDLEESDKRRLKSAVIRAVNIRQITPAGDSSIYHIFERLNTGGTPLRPQEIRNCVFHGNIVFALDSLNQDQNWRIIIGKQVPDKHQKDIEILLRIFAMFEHGKQYEKPMKEFLNKSMKENIDANSKKFQQYRSRLPIVLKILKERLPDKPFHIRGPLNLAALDSVLSTLLDAADNIPDNLADRFDSLLQNENYKDSIFYNTSDTSVVKDRLRLARKYLLK